MHTNRREVGGEAQCYLRQVMGNVMPKAFGLGSGKRLFMDAILKQT
jgi:hypothetical protein